MSIDELLCLFRRILIEHIDSCIALNEVALHHGYDFNDLLKRVQRLATGGHPVAIELLEVFNE
jgi:hypothetical protein